jgi:Tfp pilus assembly protein PilP
MPKNQAEERYLLRMNLNAGNRDRAHFQAQLKTLPGTSYEVVPQPTKSETVAYAHAAAFDYFVNTVVTVATVAGGLASIAQLLLDLIRKRGEKELLVKFNSKSIRIKGNMSRDDVVAILRNAAKVVSRENGEHIITNEKDKHQLQMLTKKRQATKENIQAYETIVETFEARPKLNSWQDRKYRAYKKKLAGFRGRLTRLDRAVRKLRTKTTSA